MKTQLFHTPTLSQLLHRIPLRLGGFVFGFVLCCCVSASAQTNYARINGFEVHPTRILVKFKSENQINSLGGSLAAIQSKVARRYQLTPRLVLLDDTVESTAATESARTQRLQGRIQALRSTGLFEYVEPDYIVHADATPTDEAFVNGTLWGLQNLGQNSGVAGADISAPDAWDLTTGSTNVIVAVIDTGIRYTHQDLAAQMWKNPGEIPNNGVDDDGNGYVDDVYGINAITGSGNPMDDNDHGTHCAGTIGAAANDGHPHVGVAWKVRLMGCKFLSASGSGATSYAIDCINYAVSKGARILNNSWGGGGPSQPLFDSIDAAQKAGVLFVAAAGNEGLDNDAVPHYPSSFEIDNIIAVAAVDRNDNLADFSNYGLSSVDLAAPGVSIYSCTSGSDSEYQVFDGTSMATPHVSGVAALILAKYPGADLEELKGRLLVGIVPIPSLTGKCTTGGRVNAFNSLAASGGGVLRMSISPPSTSVLLTSSTQPITVKVSDLFGVQNATVTATVTGSVNSTLSFLDGGVPPDAVAGDAIYTANFSVPASTGSVTMTIVASATNKITATNIVSYTFLPPPANDFFTNATKIPAAGGTFLANNKFATIETNEPVHAEVEGVAGSLWWSWTAGATTNVFVDTTGSANDTVVAVYVGNSITALQPVVSADDIGQIKQAYTSFTATNGLTYRIAVASASSNDLGSIQFRLAPGGLPDTTAPLVGITAPLSGITVLSNLLTFSGTASDPTPNASGVSEVIYRLNGGLASSVVGTTNWSAQSLLNPGNNTIIVQAYDFAHNLSAPAILQAYYLPNNPPNDIFASARVLSGNSGVDNGITTTNASKETGEPNHAGNAGGKSAWWTYQPTQDGQLALTTTNSSFDTLLAVYTGDKVSTLTLVAQNDDNPAGGSTSALTFAVRSNVIYRIAVDGYDGVSGSVSLRYQFTPATVYHLTMTITGNGTVSPGSGDVVSGDSFDLSAVPAAGYQFDHWEGDIFSLANPLATTVNGNLALTAVFVPVSHTDGFESGDLTGLGWITSGNAPWIVQGTNVALGNFAARSGVIGNSQYSSLTLSNNFQAGSASFDLRVSSEPSWDLLSFLVDGSPVHQWSGEVAWTSYSFALSAGSHTLEWRYSKDANNSMGMDAAFIDNVMLPVFTPGGAVTPAVLTAQTQTDGLVFIMVQGQTNQVYDVQASTDLVNWQTIASPVLTGGYAYVLDPGSATNQLRFYRAVATAP